MVDGKCTTCTQGQFVTVTVFGVVVLSIGAVVAVAVVCLLFLLSVRMQESDCQTLLS